MKMARAIAVRLALALTVGLIAVSPVVAQDTYAPIPTGDTLKAPAPVFDTLQTTPAALSAQEARARLFVPPSQFQVPDTLHAPPIVNESGASAGSPVHQHGSITSGKGVMDTLIQNQL